MLTVPRGAALYVGALVGPGLLLVPALAAQAAGPASIVAWAGLLVLSAPLALTFAALGPSVPSPQASPHTSATGSATRRRRSRACGFSRPASSAAPPSR